MCGSLSVLDVVVMFWSGCVYRPPNDQLELPAPGHRDCTHIVIGDINSHSTFRGYATTEAIEQWADACDLILIHGDRLPKSFNSAR